MALAKGNQYIGERNEKLRVTNHQLKAKSESQWAQLAAHKKTSTLVAGGQEKLRIRSRT